MTCRHGVDWPIRPSQSVERAEESVQRGVMFSERRYQSRSSRIRWLVQKLDH